jgi:hypothetical protein
MVRTGLDLLAASGLKELGIDPEIDGHRSAEHFSGSRHNVGDERVVQPFLKVAVRYADDQHISFDLEASVPLEPKLVAWLADTAGKRLRQLGREFTLTNRHETSPAKSAGSD